MFEVVPVYNRIPGDGCSSDAALVAMAIKAWLSGSAVGCVGCVCGGEPVSVADGVGRESDAPPLTLARHPFGVKR
jgi:hypothetical protein